MLIHNIFKFNSTQVQKSKTLQRHADKSIRSGTKAEGSTSSEGSMQAFAGSQSPPW